MDLATVFRLSIYLLLNLSALMLCLAEGAVFPQGLTFAFTLVAYQLSDRRGTFHINTLWTNLLGLAALGIAVTEVIYGEMAEMLDLRILAGGHLLVYLTWVVMLQKKQLKQYWWLAALSALQVAVGAVLTRAGWYGLFLFAYFFIAIWTLSVFSMYRASQVFRVPTWHRDVAPPLAVASGEIRLHNRSSQTIDTLHIDRSEAWISGRFSAGTLLTALGSILIGTVFFILIPRIWIGRTPFSDDDSVEAGRPLTGFTSEVRLGDFGEILESTEPVMGVRIFRNNDDEPLDVEQFARSLGYDEPLFRGTSMVGYANGRWLQRGAGSGFYGISAKSQGLGVRQEIVLEPIGVPNLFAMHPFYTIRMDNHAFNPQIHRVSAAVVLPKRQNVNKPIKYVVYSPETLQASDGIVGNRSTRRRLGLRELQAYLAFEPNDLEQLASLAKDVAGAPGLSDRERAERIESHLRDSGQYFYTLDSSVTDPSIDPIEDFLFNRRTGHCEYFASAMTLMLRAVGVPARLVSGFKGGLINSVTGEYEVQQRHAHAWVEALIDGRWAAFDPTPAERADSIASLDPTLQTWADLKRFIAILWSDQVLDMSLQYQSQNIYEPLQNSVLGLWQEVDGDKGRTKSLGQQIKDFLLNPKTWFSWQGWLATFVFLIVFSCAIWGLRRLWARIRDWRQREQRLRRQQLRVAFYERFREICERSGLVREPWQSYREYARTVTAGLQKRLSAEQLEAAPFEIVERFLEVRFGDAELSPEAIAQMEAAVTRLEECLDNGVQEPAAVGAGSDS